MPRQARIVVPGSPHHITQRGNRRQLTFFKDDDYQQYLVLMREQCERNGVEIWSYCLMPNHVHLIAVPSSEEGLRKAIGEAHKQYSSIVNSRERWTGHLWQGRFASFLMDERYMLAAARYIELNPVKAGMVAAPWDYLWSSARTHVSGRKDILVKKRALLEFEPDWRGHLASFDDLKFSDKVDDHARTGYPMMGEDRLATLERETGRTLRIRKRGRPFKTEILEAVAAQ